MFIDAQGGGDEVGGRKEGKYSNHPPLRQISKHLLIKSQENIKDYSLKLFNFLEIYNYSYKMLMIYYTIYFSQFQNVV